VNEGTEAEGGGVGTKGPSNSIAIESKSRLRIETEIGRPKALVNESPEMTPPSPPDERLGWGARGGGGAEAS